MIKAVSPGLFLQKHFSEILNEYARVYSHLCLLSKGFARVERLYGHPSSSEVLEHLFHPRARFPRAGPRCPPVAAASRTAPHFPCALSPSRLRNLEKFQH